MVPSNIRQFASFVSRYADIQRTVIHYKSTPNDEVILNVPFRTPKSAVVITIGIDSSTLNKDESALMISVSDSSHRNAFYIVDAKRYDRYPPCYTLGASRDDNRVSEGTKAPFVVKITLYPWERVGYCETAQ